MLRQFFRRFARRNSLIADALNQFESIAKRIDEGVAINNATIDANDVAIGRLERESDELFTEAARGVAVAAKLREFIA